MIAFDNLSQEQRYYLNMLRMVWALSCPCQCAECRVMFNELQRICGDDVPADHLHEVTKVMDTCEQCVDDVSEKLSTQHQPE